MSFSFDFTPEQEELQRSVQDFAERELAPIVVRVDEEDEFPWEIWRKMAAAPRCWTGAHIPKEYGGKPRPIIDICIITEELATVMPIASALIEVAGFGVMTIINAGNEEQKKRYLPPIAKGDGLGCFSLTEPVAGSDAAAIVTKAELIGNEWVINGLKRYLSFAHEAIANEGSYIIVFAKTDYTKGAKGVSAFIVPGNTKGIKILEMIPCVGLRGHQDEEVLFENCRIPKENLIGEQGMGFKYALTSLDETRTTLSAGFIGLARAALKATIDFAKERHTFGKPLAEYQALRFPLTEVAIEIEAARLLTYKAAWLADRGVRHTVETAGAKAFAAQVMVKATQVALDTHGGIGGTKRLPIERYHRDAIIWQFAQGAPNILRLIVSRDLFKQFP